jgi:hypothetical protein
MKSFLIIGIVCFLLGAGISAVVTFNLVDNKRVYEKYSYEQIINEQQRYYENYLHVSGLDTMSINQRRDWLESITRKNQINSACRQR